jgi:hypothetical protein
MTPSPEDQDRVIAALWGVDPNASGFRSQVLDKLRIEFERTPNPMLPWSALRWARSRGVDVPEWVMGYLYDKAVVLTEIVAENAKQEAREVGRALGFGAGGKGSVAGGSKLRQRWRSCEIAIRIADLMKQGVKEAAAITEAAEALSVSPATAYRAHADDGDRAARFVELILNVSHEIRIS